MNSAPSQYPIALGITAGNLNPYPVPLNVTIYKDVSDRVEAMPVKVPFKPIQPVPILKVPQYKL